jgi:hypothetical protein
MGYTHIDTRKIKKSRKIHVCDWCGEQIHVGESYTKVIGIFDGEFNATKFHEECDLACSEYCSNNYVEDGFDPRAFVRGKPCHFDDFDAKSKECKGCDQLEGCLWLHARY